MNDSFNRQNSESFKARPKGIEKYFLGISLNLWKSKELKPSFSNENQTFVSEKTIEKQFKS